jgi:16S rRNA (adenine1518-N6/adenine1519-N6)-dimethyltransferase
MYSPKRQTRSHLMDLFEQQGLHPRGDLGQNFLIDLNLLESIVTEADLGPDDVVLEVGAGTGGMTTYLAAEAGAVVSVEYDPNMYRLANEVTSHLPDMTLLNCDALKNKNQLNPLVTDAVDAYLAVDPARRLKLVANLPYHIGTPVIANLLASNYPWSRMVVTIQYELAQRLNAKPGTSDYGALSVLVQAQCDVKVVHKLPPTVFWPRPKVDSAIVRIDPNPTKAALIHDRSGLHVFLRDVFGQRRKVLAGVLAQMYKGRITRAVIDETLQVAQLVELSNRIQSITSAAILQNNQ